LFPPPPLILSPLSFIFSAQLHLLGTPPPPGFHPGHGQRAFLFFVPTFNPGLLFLPFSPTRSHSPSVFGNFNPPPLVGPGQLTCAGNFVLEVRGFFEGQSPSPFFAPLLSNIVLSLDFFEPCVFMRKDSELSSLFPRFVVSFCVFFYLAVVFPLTPQRKKLPRPLPFFAPPDKLFSFPHGFSRCFFLAEGLFFPLCHLSVSF